MDLLPSDALEAAAECLKVMAHPVRLKIVDILLQGEFCVNDIARLCEIPPHQACGHLRLLQGHGLLDSHRESRTVLYRVISPNLPGLIRCLRQNCGQPMEVQPFSLEGRGRPAGPGEGAGRRKRTTLPRQRREKGRPSLPYPALPSRANG